MITNEENTESPLTTNRANNNATKKSHILRGHHDGYKLRKRRTTPKNNQIKLCHSQKQQHHDHRRHSDG